MPLQPLMSCLTQLSCRRRLGCVHPPRLLLWEHAHQIAAWPGHAADSEAQPSHAAASCFTALQGCLCRLDLGVMRINAARFLGDMPIRIWARTRDGRVLWDLELWHRSQAQHQRPKSAPLQSENAGRSSAQQAGWLSMHWPGRRSSDP